MTAGSLSRPGNQGFSPGSRIRRALGATVVVSAFGYASQILSLVALPIYLTTLGAEGYGLMVTVMAFMGYLGFADAGLTWGSMILIAQANGRDDRQRIAHIVRHSAVLALGSGLVVALILFGVLFSSQAGWRLPMFAHRPEANRLLVIAGVQLALTLQFGVFYNIFHGLQEGYWTGFYQGLGRLLGLAAATLVAWMTRSVAAVMLTQLVFTVLSGTAAAIHVWRLHSWAFTGGSWSDRLQYREQLSVGAKSFLLQIGRTLGATAPTLGIASILGPAAVPLYTVPSTLISLFFTPINSWNASMQSAYGEAWTSGSRDWTRKAFRHSLEQALIFGGLGIALFLALGDPFIRLWTRGRLWLSPGMALSVAGVALTVAAITSGEYLLTGLNRHRGAAIAELANGCLALVLVVMVVKYFGLGSVGLGVVGAALATCVWYLRREIRSQIGEGFQPTGPFMLKVSLSVAASFLAAKAIAVMVGHGDTRQMVIGLFGGGAAGLAVFLAASLVLGLVVMADAVELGRRLKRRLVGVPS